MKETVVVSTRIPVERRKEVSEATKKHGFKNDSELLFTALDKYLEILKVQDDTAIKA